MKHVILDAMIMGVVCDGKVTFTPNILMPDCGMTNHSLPHTTDGAMED